MVNSRFQIKNNKIIYTIFDLKGRGGCMKIKYYYTFMGCERLQLMVVILSMNLQSKLWQKAEAIANRSKAKGVKYEYHLFS
jgi:hypothetical protein